MAVQSNGNGQGPLNPNATQQQNGDDEWYENIRGWIMVVAILVASVTYASGLNPPGGFWQEDFHGHEAGGPILHDKHQTRYTTFFYGNATAFMTSLVIIILLMNKKFYVHKAKVMILYISLVVGLVSLMISYAAGSTRRFSTSFYVIGLAVVVMVFVVYSADVMHAAFGRNDQAQNRNRSQNI